MATVPAGQQWHVTMFQNQYTGTVTNVVLYKYATIAGVRVYLERLSPIVNGVVNVEIVDVLLEAGDALGCRIVNATLNDSLVAYIAAQRTN